MESLGISSLWLIAGVVLLALEAFGLPGAGLLFAGIGALTVGSVLRLGLLDNAAYAMQGALFLFSTAIATLLLWKPLQTFRIRVKNKPVYDSLLGGMATVHGAPLIKGREGQVTWSGTIMTAEIAPDAPIQEIATGGRVKIVDVRGALVIVRPEI